MKMIVTTVLTAMALVSVAAPAWADVAITPPSPVDVVTQSTTTPLLYIGLACCLGLFVIAAIVVGVILIVRHNKKKQAGE